MSHVVDLATTVLEFAGHACLDGLNFAVRPAVLAHHAAALLPTANGASTSTLFSGVGITSGLVASVSLGVFAVAAEGFLDRQRLASSQKLNIARVAYIPWFVDGVLQFTQILLLPAAWGGRYVR